MCSCNKDVEGLHRQIPARLSAAPLTTAVRVQGDAQNSTVTDEVLTQLLDRSHLARKVSAPYESKGPGYELIAQQTAGLLSSVS